MKAPSTKHYVLMMLGLLMASHLAFLGFAAGSCDNSSRKLPPGYHTGEVCHRLPVEFQKAVETYIAVILALLAPISTVD